MANSAVPRKGPADGHLADQCIYMYIQRGSRRTWRWSTPKPSSNGASTSSPMSLDRKPSESIRMTGFAARFRRIFEQDLFGSDPAVLHLDDSIGRVGNARIVGHHQNRAAVVARQLDKQFDDFAARLAVQR